MTDPIDPLASTPLIVLYEGINGYGRTIDLSTSHPNLQTFGLGRPGNDDWLSSLVVVSGVWRLCRAVDYGLELGHDYPPGHYNPDTTGKGFYNDDISSVRLVRATNDRLGEIRLFTGPDYVNRPAMAVKDRFFEGDPNFEKSGIWSEVQSFKIIHGTWEVFDSVETRQFLAGQQFPNLQAAALGRINRIRFITNSN